MGGTLSSAGLSTSKAFGLKSGMFSNNTILEEMSPASQSMSSSSKQDMNFPGILSNTSGDVFNKKESSSNLDL